MITRIQLLRNIGQFDFVNAGATIPLARLTLVYSENGRGKTTLAAVLRSLATGDPIPIAERRRLAAQNPPHVVLECAGGPPPAVFENNAWNRILPDLLVFDDMFIDQNVHSGLAVHSHHRQNLHELILGAQAVALSRLLQQLVDRIEEHNRELRVKERAIPDADRGGLSVDDFCALPVRPDIDQAIQEAERASAAARQHDVIRTTSPFDMLRLPELDIAEAEGILRQDLPALDAATLIHVEDHLARLGEGGEAWVAEGMRRIPHLDQDPTVGGCPFCAQDLHGLPLIEHYRMYFSDAYGALKRTVSDALAELGRVHGGDEPAGFERAVWVAVERRHFWARFCEVGEFTLDTAALVRDWRSAVDSLLAQLSAKQAAPLERMGFSEHTRALVAAYEARRSEITTLNRHLENANLVIAAAKEKAETANLKVLANDLAWLRALKARQEPATAALCEDYLHERAAKEQTEQERDHARDRLERYRQEVFPQYQTAINQHLAEFNAGFRLDSVTYVNTRGGPACTYSILINRTPVPVAGGDPGPGDPSFGNTLSAGDRNTLALAFFFASLDQDTDLANKVVVIDDPISSLDEHRALTTVQEIRHLVERAGQVIILSHKKPFLCRLWEGADPTMRAALEAVRDAAGSTLRVWDVTEDSVTEHDRRHVRLHEYLMTGIGDPREVARSIRPHLEAFLRVACPEPFPAGTLLGRFLNLCDRRLGTPQEILDRAGIGELRALVEYASRLHHDTNPAWETEAINDGELGGFVERTMRFSRR
jgi:wobble nucleotide-excising tRNase